MAQINKAVKPTAFQQAYKKSIKWLPLLLLFGMQLLVAAHAQNMVGDPSIGLENGGGRYPFKVIVRYDTSPNQGDGGHNTEYDGPNVWGHTCTYDLTLLDNYNNPYGLGDIQEVFSNNKNSAYVNQFWPGGQGSTPGPGYTWRNGADFVSGNWTDHNNATETQFETGRSTFWLSFDQKFNSINSPAGEYDQNPPYHLQVVQAHPTRS
jgi:hypothetical protein